MKMIAERAIGSILHINRSVVIRGFLRLELIRSQLEGKPNNMSWYTSMHDNNMIDPV